MNSLYSIIQSNDFSSIRSSVFYHQEISLHEKSIFCQRSEGDVHILFDEQFKLNRGLQFCSSSGIVLNLISTNWIWCVCVCQTLEIYRSQRVRNVIKPANRLLVENALALVVWLIITVARECIQRTVTIWFERDFLIAKAIVHWSCVCIKYIEHQRAQCSPSYPNSVGVQLSKRL